MAALGAIHGVTKLLLTRDRLLDLNTHMTTGITMHSLLENFGCSAIMVLTRSAGFIAGCVGASLPQVMRYIGIGNSFTHNELVLITDRWVWIPGDLLELRQGWSQIFGMY